MDSLLDIMGNYGAQAAFASIAIPVIIQRIKKWGLVQKTWVINIIVGLLAFIPVAIDSILQAVSEAPTILGIKTVAIVGFVQYAYTIFVKPVSAVFTDAKLERERKLQLSSVETHNLVTPEVAADIAPDPSAVESVAPVSAADF